MTRIFTTQASQVYRGLSLIEISQPKPQGLIERDFLDQVGLGFACEFECCMNQLVTLGDIAFANQKNIL